jgi:hypothetical protein
MAKTEPDQEEPVDPATLRLQARAEGKPVVIKREFRRRKRKRESPEALEERQKNSEAHARRRLDRKMTVPMTLVDPHPLIKLTQKAFEKASPDKDGILDCRTKKRLPISVSQAQMDRAILIMDTLLKAIVAAGYEPEIANKGGPKVSVTVDDEMIEFSISEIIERNPHKPTREEKAKKEKDPIFYEWPRWDYFLTGKLRLSIDNVSGGPKKSWTDGKRWIVEDCIDAFVQTLGKSADRIKEIREIEEQRRLEREEWHRQYELEQKRKEERRARIEEERKRVGQLEKELARMQAADSIRQYADRLEQALTPEGAVLLPWCEPGWWIRWCRRYADILDPTVIGTGMPVTSKSDYCYGLYGDNIQYELATEKL